jgi:predicted transcriptional regulator
MTNLGMALAAFQQKHDIENREMAKQIGIPPSTLSRIKGGTMPDALGMAKIMLWLATVSRS